MNKDRNLPVLGRPPARWRPLWLWLRYSLFASAAFTLAPHGCYYGTPRELGWPFAAIEWVPAFMYIMGGPVGYQDYVRHMDAMWRTRSDIIGPQFAKVCYNTSYRWVRLPNGHVVTVSPSRMAGNFLVFGAVCGLITAARDRTRYHGRRPSCLSCGYDLRGSLGSRRCPECGTALNWTSGGSQERGMRIDDE